MLVPPGVIGADPALGVVEALSAGSVPACKPRSAAAPARLNIDVSALRHGVIPPCEAVVELYIARNTSLRALAGTVRYVDSEGVAVLESPFVAKFEDGGNGMLQHRLVGPPVANLMCHDLDLVVELASCRDEMNRRIDCPSVRAKDSYVFERIVVHGDGIDLCAD